MTEVTIPPFEAIEAFRLDLSLRGLAHWAPLPAAEVRGMDGGTGDGSYTMHGLAAVFDTPTTLYDGKSLRITEDLAPGSFSPALGDPDLLVHFNHGHNMNSAIATTDVPANEIGGLELRQADDGLRYFARVDSEDPDAKSLAVKMYRKVVKGASFKFQIGNEKRTETEDSDTGKVTVHYRINQVSQLFDVCACAQGAYRAATSNLRSYAAMAQLLDRRGDDLPGEPHRSDLEGEIPAAPEVGSEEERELVLAGRRREIARLHARNQLVTSQTRS